MSPPFSSVSAPILSCQTELFLLSHSHIWWPRSDNYLLDWVCTQVSHTQSLLFFKKKRTPPSFVIQNVSNWEQIVNILYSRVWISFIARCKQVGEAITVSPSTQRTNKCPKFTLPVYWTILTAYATDKGIPLLAPRSALSHVLSSRWCRDALCARGISCVEGSTLRGSDFRILCVCVCVF